MFKRILSNLVPPSSGERFPALDGLRALAILGVLVGHTAGLYEILPSAIQGIGGVAVTLLFGLSGFLLYHPIIQRKQLPPLKRYYLRRFLRIYPLYALGLVVCLYIIPHARGTSLPTLIANLVFVQNFSSQWRQAINPTMWFLVPLIHFYLLFPLLAWFCLRWRFGLLTVIALALFAQYRVFYPIWWPLHHNLPFLLLPFISGMGVAHLAINHWRSPRWLLPIILSCLAIYALFIRPLALGNPNLLAWIMRGPAICFFVCLALWAGTAGNTILGSRPFFIIASAGYGAYLFHYPIHAIIHPFLGPVGSTPLMAPLSLIVGFLSHKYIELRLSLFAKPLRPQSTAPPLPLESPGVVSRS